MKFPLSQIEGVIPEKKECARHYNPAPNICDCDTKGFNQCIDQLAGTVVEGEWKKIRRVMGKATNDWWNIARKEEVQCKIPQINDFVAQAIAQALPKILKVVKP